MYVYIYTSNCYGIIIIIIIITCRCIKKTVCMHKYELDSIMLKGCSCDKLENSV